jgi:hypothetical protein
MPPFIKGALVFGVPRQRQCLHHSPLAKGVARSAGGFKFYLQAPPSIPESPALHARIRHARWDNVGRSCPAIV